MVSREKVQELDRRTWGDDWASAAEMILRERAVRFDSALSVELGGRALLYLASEYSTPNATVWAHLYGRPVVSNLEAEIA